MWKDGPEVCDGRWGRGVCESCSEVVDNDGLVYGV